MRTGFAPLLENDGEDYARQAVLNYRAVTRKNSPMEKSCVTCGIVKPFNDFYNEKKRSDGKMPQCIQCNKTARAIYRQNNREKERIRNRLYGAQNKELVKSKVMRWRRNNPTKNRALRRMREMQKIYACPQWAQLGLIRKEILAHYLHAEWLEAVTEEKMHVDHIVPLRSDFVCGLHVPANLMVLTAKDNMSKNACWWPGQLPCQVGRGKSHEWWNELYKQMQEDYCW